MSVNWIEYKSHKILYVDYRNMKDKETILNNLEEQKQVVEKCISPILLLIDYRDMHVFDEFMQKVKKYGKEHADKTSKIGVLGVQGIKKILFNAYLAFTNSKNTWAFNTEEEAKEFLIKK